MRIYRFFILLCLAPYLCSCANAQTIEPLFECTEKLESPYGITSHISRDWPTFKDYSLRNQELAGIKRAGINYVRTNLDYTTLRPYGQWSPSKIDSTYLSTKSQKIKFYGIINGECEGVRAWEDSLNYFDYVKYLTERYSHTTDAWEIVNEFELSKNVDNIADRYMWILENVVPIVRERSKAPILSTSLSKSDGDFLSEISKKGAYRYFDVLNFHKYDVPENLPHYYKQLATVMQRDGWSKPVWLTECGLSSVPETKYANHTEADQAKQIARFHLISFAYGVDKVFIYNYRSREEDRKNWEDHYGIVHADLSPKPAYFAYKTLTKMLPSRSTRPLLAKDGSAYLCAWEYNGKKVWAVWDTAKIFHKEVIVKGKAKVYDYLGNKVKIKNNTICLSDGVCYIVGAKDVTLK